MDRLSSNAVRHGTLVLLGALGLIGLAPAAANAQNAVPVDSASSAPAVAPQDADRLARLVQAEDDRLAEVRRLLQEFSAPFRVGSASGGYTLVLTARSAPYTVADLLMLAPQTFIEQRAGTYLLSEHLLVAPGAALELSRPAGLDLRLASSPTNFVSLTGLGGRLALSGAANASLRLTSWDADRGQPDTDSSDGRAYVRALDGQLELQHVQASALGFWSGRTGGIAVTGTDGLTTRAALAEGPPAQPDGAQGTTVQPAGPLSAGQPAPPRAAAVTGGLGPSRIGNTVIDGDAYGLFVSGANDLRVTDSIVRHSSIAGVVLHRDVTGALIRATASTDNAGDGFRLDSTTGVTLDGVTARRNAGNGISLSGSPLAEGPSPTGFTTRSFGDNAVLRSTVVENTRYGIASVGGYDLRFQDNVVSGNDMGIFVSGPAERVTISNNTVTNATRHGIALVDQVIASNVRHNTVDGSATGLYLRDSQARVVGNTVRQASRHGVSFVGDVGGSQLGTNVLTGTGTGAAAVDRARATGPITTMENRITGWRDTQSLRRWAGLFLHPMNALWLIIALLLVVSAIRSRVRTRSGVVHPYAHQMAHHGLLALPDHSVIDLRDRKETNVSSA